MQFGRGSVGCGELHGQPERRKEHGVIPMRSSRHLRGTGVESRPFLREAGVEGVCSTPDHSGTRPVPGSVAREYRGTPIRLSSSAGHRGGKAVQGSDVARPGCLGLI
jgi:hypothetical protein